MLSRFRQFVSAFILIAAGAFFFGGIALDLVQIQKKDEPIRVGSKLTYALEKRPIAILLYDDGSSDAAKSFASIEEQTYPNYRVIHLKDSGNKIGALYDAIHKCSDEEIVLFMDAGDILAHERSLKAINYCYEDPGVWLTYGNSLKYPSYRREGRKNLLRNLTKKNLRQYDLSKALPAPRTALAKLAKRVRKEDLLADGEFFPAAFEEAYFYPMLEMAGSHMRFVKDILMITKQPPRAFEEMEWAKKIGERDPYSPIDEITFLKKN